MRRAYGPTRPPVRSEPLEKKEEKTKPQGSLYALAIVLLTFGTLGWIAGGKYTVEGWVVALNMFARWVGIREQLAIPRGWWLVGAVVLSGFVYSKVELLAWKNTVHRLPTFWIGWVLIVLTDVGSTLLGIVNPPPDAAPIFLQLAATPFVAIIWALVLTAAPEYLILGGMRLFRR